MPDIAVVGPWAKEKLEALERYLDFYTKVLKNQRWRTIYVDAFAGGGRALVRADSAQVDESIPLFEPEPASDVDRTELIDGSPRVALNVANPFSRYVFVENDPARCEELEAVKVEFDSTRQIDILRTSAADAHHPARLSSAGDCDQGSDPGTDWRQAMTKLKLTDLAEDKPIRLTIELPAAVHRDLVAYAAVLGAGQGAISPDKLIAPMVQRFMATDRAFLQARRGTQLPPPAG